MGLPKVMVFKEIQEKLRGNHGLEHLEALDFLKNTFSSILRGKKWN
jgi:hypothetical protein